MQLSIREAARLLNVEERQVYRWLDAGDIPACRIGDEARFNRAELLEWATMRRLPLSSELLQEPADGCRLSQALEEGGVRYGLRAADRAQAFSAMIAALPLPEGADRETIASLLLARGEHAMTPVGNGIAIPHVRQPAVLELPRPLVTLLFFQAPVDLGAPDGIAVGTMFFLLSPTVRAHLQILSRLAAALRDPGLKAALTRQAPAADILREVRRIEGIG